MKSVLQKTMVSLESALRYNPTSLELMASLAEVYVRLGKFDQRTLELCEHVLLRQADNVLLHQAQAIGMLIEQAREVEEALREGQAAPPPEALDSAISTLDEFLAQSPECADAWLAWTRFQLLRLNFGKAYEGVERLRGLETPGLDQTFNGSLREVAGRDDLTSAQSVGLAEFWCAVGSPAEALRLFEKLHGEGRLTLGPGLLTLYLRKFPLARAGELPLPLRALFFKLLLDYGDPETIGHWLRKAGVLGWQIDEFSNDYAKILIDQNELDEAFGVLQRSVLDGAVKQMLNDIALRYEQRDEVEKAVAVLRFLNDHELADDASQRARESELVRDAQLSMAEMQMKNGRPREALEKFITALCLGGQTDLSILSRIDELLDEPGVADVELLLRLGLYFRRLKDWPKALAYLNQAGDMAPENREVLDELEDMFREILETNPDLPQLRLELARLYLRTGRRAQALPELKQAAASPGLAQQANRLLAREYATEGLLTEALERFRLLKIEDEDLESLYNLHLCFADRQAWREACSALDLISRCSPGYRDVGEKLRTYEERIGKLQPEIVVDPKMRELIGDLAVGRYQYMEKLGSGGMGVVHKVYDIRNKQAVAMKILRDSLAGSSKALDRFFREARIAATLCHRNIVNIYDYNISNVSGQSYIVMEYVDGPSLREIVDRQFQNNITVSLDYVTEILHYSVQLCDALNVSHTRGIVHRDIKPDNIMVNSRGEVKITDFGIVHIEEASFTPSGAMLGTPRYMSPEQVSGGKIDGRSDIYSVGILLYEVLVGSPPFMSGDISYQQVHATPTPLRDINPTIPQGVADVVMKCLNKKPEDRYADALLLKRDLGQSLDGLGGCAKWVSNCTEMIEPEMDTELDRVM